VRSKQKSSFAACCLLPVACCLLSACGGDGPKSLFNVGILEGAPAEFFELPYPNALRLDADGTPALAGFYRGDALLALYTDLIDQHGRGFGPTQAIYVRWDGELDPASLPDSATTMTDGAAAFLVDVTTGSAHRGEKIPLQFRFEPRHLDFIGDDWLAMQPVPGYPPREGETYAAVVLDSVRGKDGGTRAPSSLRRVLDGNPDGAAESKMATAFAPLVAWLDEHDLRDRVSAATVYTTAVGSTIMDELRSAVLATPAPVVADLAHSPMVRESCEVYTATYLGPNFQEGAPPYATTGGEIHRGADGKPEPVRTETLRLAITLPKTGAMPDAGWPVVIYMHGTGGDYMSFVKEGVGDTLAVVTAKDGSELSRMAVVSIDQVLHGPRSPEGTDVDTAFFNFNNLLAARDNVKQGALDDFQLIRLVQTIDVAAAPETGQRIKFDPSKIYYFGHSQGSLTGGLYVPADPDIKAAIFSGAGAGLVGGLLHKTAPVDIAAVVQSLFRDPVDDYHPFLNILQGFFDESDPANYLRRLFIEPPPGFAAKDVFVTLGLRDSYAPDETIATFSLAAGVRPVNPQLLAIDGMALDGRGWVDAPQAGNVAGGRTGVVVEYDPGTRDDGHFVVFDVRSATMQTARFLGTLAKTGTASLDPP
jgi:predicted esterase